MDLFFTDEKLNYLIALLEEHRAKESIQLHNIRTLEDTSGIVNPAVPSPEAAWEETALGTIWTGRDRYIWLSGEMEIPASWAGQGMICGKFDFGKTGGGGNSGFEALLYVDGKPFQGVDTNHSEVFFDDSWAGKTVPLTFRLWSGLEGGGVPTPQTHVLRTAQSQLIDIDADQLFFLSKMCMKTLPTLDENDPVKYSLRSAVDSAFLQLDWTNEGSAEFYASAGRALQQLSQSIEKIGKQPRVHVTCVGHTHIDVAWLWRYKHTREKAARSFSTVLRLMDMYPEYTFFQSQPQLYDFIKTDFPELYEKIKERIREGRWEVDGAMWVEPDCNIPSGESLTRQILFGSRFVEQEFGRKMHCLWLPDVFGYSWALPQILKKSGIDTFFTTKISWNEYNRVNNDTFKWIGMDGSEVMAHFITTPCSADETSEWFYSYNGDMTPGTISGLWKNYQNKDLTDKLLCSYGYGDGGGGVNRPELEQRRMMDRIPGLPEVKPGHVEAYIQELRQDLDQADWRVPTWDGELYLEFHRGTYTSHAFVKMMNRRLELAYRNAEWLSVISGILGRCLDTDDQETLNRGWKIILRNQFHDVLPGSSIHDVYEDVKEEYAEADEIAGKVVVSAAARLLEEKEGVYTVVNNSGWSCSGLVALPPLSGVDYFDASGALLPSQTSGEQTYVYMPDVPAASFSPIYVKKAVAQSLEAPFSLDGRELRTPYYQITFNEAGQITSLYDRENHRSVMREGDRGNVLLAFDDRPFMYDAWNVNIYYQEKHTEITDLVSFAMTECGPLRAVLHFVWRYNKSTFEQDMIVYSHSRRIDFVTEVDMHETHKFFKTSFPVDIRANYGTYDVQYGNVKRGNTWNTSWDVAKFETVAHKWMDLSEHNYGVSILNDSKYGCDIRGRVMRLSLLKTATDPDHLQDQGHHQFTYSLYPHAGDVYNAAVEREAFLLNNPLYALEGYRQTGSMIAFNSPYVALDALKRAEDGGAVVLRFHEFTGSHRTVTVTPGFAYSAWAESDLMEHPAGEFTDGRITLDVGPFEVKTILIRL